MNFRSLALIIAFVSSSAPAVVLANQKQELLEIKNTIVNLAEALVAQGILNEAQWQELKKQAEEKARQAAIEASEEYAEGSATEPAKKIVRVPYVPEFIKDEIRAEVKQELRKEVAGDVTALAKAEGWGTKDALPGWVNRFKMFGDFRLRLESTQFDNANQPFTYPNFLAINANNDISSPNTFFNFTEDRERVRARLRFGFDAKVADNVKVGVRLSTGNQNDPASMNQSFGQTFGPYNIIIDRAFLKWDFDNDYGENWLELMGGRMKRPFLATGLVWDNDISFEGLAARLSQRFGFGGDDLLAQDFRNYMIYLTLGAFPLDTDELPFDDGSSNDKYLLGGQLGFKWTANNQSSIELAGSVYDYVNIVGKFNPDGAFGNTRFDWTAPGFLSKGNTMYPIRFDAAGNPTLFGLASDYTLANITGRVNLSFLAPLFVTLTGDFVKNYGFNEADVERRTGVRVAGKTNGWQARLDVGWPRVTEFGQWRAMAAYKYIERDAVLDAFNESNFHLGGTDAKGWVFAATMGLTQRTSLRLRYFAADEIDLAPLGTDLFQLDLTTQF